MTQIDLHVHTCYSDDADFSPQQIFNWAEEKGLAAIAVTDHDTTKGIPKALELAKTRNLEVVPGIELDTTYQDTNLHILGYYFDWQGKALDELLDGMEEAKDKQLRARIEKLQNLGFEISLEEVLAKSEEKRPPGGTIAQIMLDKSENKKKDSLQPYLTGDKSDQPAFNFYYDFFAQGGPAYVPRWKPAAKEAIEVIRQLGGVAVLAHPGSVLKPTDKKVISELKEAGLTGLEVYSTYHSPQEITGFKQLAREFDLLATAGSDFHGKLKPEIELGGVKNNSYEILTVLKKLQEGKYE